MFAVFQRNFVAYFLNPTGYVFICVFVLLGSIAAFLPDEFVNANLADLSQLNLWFPLVVLVFIPAIAMGIWADERRQGTEELLTTVPLSATQIVCGKYAAAVGIYSVSLLFSAGANFAILEFLGNPDVGLFLATYCGYWLIGWAMLAVASVASFLTGQLTIAYILGALFNVPLVALQWADAAPISRQTATLLKSFSLNGLFEPFGRGIVSVADAVFLFAISGVMIYACVVFLNRRFWTATRPARFALRYSFRFASLFVVAVSLAGLIRLHNVRWDWTEENLSSLSPETIRMIQEQQAEYPIVIEAYLSPEVPQELVQTRLDIISVLNEIKNRATSDVFLEFYEILPNTTEAWRLERQYDIRPKKVVFDRRGQIREESVFLSIIFRCGPKTIVIPFMNRGLSVEYELVDAWVNIGDRTKKRLGILKTDAALLGRFDSFGSQISPQWQIVDELSKQYIVEQVDTIEPIPEGRFDVLLAVQPSSLGPAETANFADSLRRGQPTVIFEDPLPLFVSQYLPGTKSPRTPSSPSFPSPKGEINLIWAILGVAFDSNVLWKNYNPYPKLAVLSEEFVFVDANPISFQNLSDEANDSRSSDSNAPKTTKAKSTTDVANDSESAEAFSQTEISVASLEHLLFPFAGSIAENPRGETQIIPLIRTQAGGTGSVESVRLDRVQSYCRTRTDQTGVYNLAVRITGDVPKVFRLAESDGKSNNVPRLNVILVADVDLLTNGFFALRGLGVDSRTGVAFDFDNVPFVLNAIDQVADDTRLVAVRSRRPKRRTLTTLEEATQKVRNRAAVDQIAFLKELEGERKKEQEKLDRKIQELANRRESDQSLSGDESLELQSAMQASQQRLEQVLDEKQRQYDRKVEESQRDVAESVRKIQGQYKLFAVLLPPIIPVLIGATVFVYRTRRRRSIVR